MTPTDLDAYFEQFRGDPDPMSICRERGRHNWGMGWFQTLNGRTIRCVDCGVEYVEPYDHAPSRTDNMAWQASRLDAELKKT